jgi:uncharacterized membrane protein YoaK (UPF0700 family)
MSTIESTAVDTGPGASRDVTVPARTEKWLPILLSVIAGMVDLIGFLSLGIFTAHVTGNIVVVGALLVRHNRVNPAQILAIPIFMLAVAATWIIAKTSGRSGSALMRPLLLIQFSLITCLSIFSVISKPSSNPHGLSATIAAMIAVSAMGCQFALLRLVLPVAPSTAVMTGNLTNVVLGLLDLSSPGQPLIESDSKRLNGGLRLIIGFFVGCVAAAAAVTYLGDWAWLFPAGLAGVAVALS